MLSLLKVDHTELMATLQSDEYVDTFTDFDPEDYGSFDSTVMTLTDIMSELLDSSNPALAGAYEYIDPKPSESIACILCANFDGMIEGFVFTYDLYGQRPLSLGSRFYEYKHIRPQQSGYTGLLEMADDVIYAVNEAITNFNTFLKGSA